MAKFNLRLQASLIVGAVYITFVYFVMPNAFDRDASFYMASINCLFLIGLSDLLRKISFLGVEVLLAVVLPPLFLAIFYLAMGYRVRFNEGYIFLAVFISWPLLIVLLAIGSFISAFERNQKD